MERMFSKNRGLSYKKLGSVIKRTPAHSRIVVAVPTKYRLAFSEPVVAGLNFTSFASGIVGRVAVSECSRVGGKGLEGSRIKR